MTDFDEYDDWHDYEEDDEPEPLDIPEDEPLLAALLKTAIARYWPDDAVMHDFSEMVLPYVVDVMASFSAKGGQFATDKAEEGSDTAHYRRDQSMRAHILNGLLASLNILRLAVEAGNSIAQSIDDYGWRLLIATYILHDYTKLLGPELHDAIGTPSAENMPMIRREIIQWTEAFNLPMFFHQGGHELHLPDLIFAIHNTQVKWGTMPARLLAANVTDRQQVRMVANFSRIADLLAYGTFLEFTTLDRINTILTETLGERPFDLTAHRVTQVTGILTAYIHNAVIEAMQEHGHEPILFAPNGVIYASPRDARIPEIGTIADAAIDRVQHAALQGIHRLAITTNPVGLSWGTQGLKIAPFIEDLLAPVQILELVWRHLTRRLHDSRPVKPPALKVYKRLKKGTDSGWFSAEQVEPLVEHIDRRAEAIGDWLAFAITLPDPIGEQAVEIIITTLGFAMDDVQSVIDIAQKGGVHYWSALVAATFIAQHPTFSPEQVGDYIKDQIFPQLQNELSHYPSGGMLLESLRVYIQQSISLPQREMAEVERFAAEFDRYNLAKVDRQRGVYDTLYNLPDSVEQQQDATLPYMPTPYSQRLPLGKGDSLKSGWRRGISSIGVVNMLLMQLALRDPFPFEAHKSKMVFLYPVYYFTPETGDVLLNILRRLRTFNIAGWLRHTQSGLDLDTRKAAHYHDVLDKPTRFTSIKPMAYPAVIAPTLAQISFDSGKSKITDIESWVNPVIVSLILATVVDVKIAVSESPVPLYQAGTGFDETVIFDALHPAYADLIGRAIKVDSVLGALERMTVMLAIMQDAYGYDFGRLADIGRQLSEEPATVFIYYRRLSERRKRDPHVDDARRYLQYAAILERTAHKQQRSDTVNHARELVTRYRRFYRAYYPLKTSTILRPIQESAKIILASDAAHSAPDMLVETICGKLIQIDIAISNNQAKGYHPKGSKYQDLHAAMRDFAEYFVYTYFIEGLKGRTSLLRGTQFNLLRLACDAVYRDLDATERQSKNEGENES